MSKLLTILLKMSANSRYDWLRVPFAVCFQLCVRASGKRSFWLKLLSGQPRREKNLRGATKKACEGNSDTDSKDTTRLAKLMKRAM